MLSSWLDLGLAQNANILFSGPHGIESEDRAFSFPFNYLYWHRKLLALLGSPWPPYWAC